MKLFLVISILVVCSKEVRTESPDWNKVHLLTVHGLNRLYSLEIDDAIRSFDSVSVLAPRDPRGPFFLSMAHFYLYGLNRKEADLNAFFDQSERVIGICEYLLDRNGNDATTKFYLGGIYGYRGLAHQTSGSTLKAAKDGRKGYLLLEEAVSENPNLYDAQMGFGLFKYLLAKVPKSMKWILSILGFSGDLEGGLASLRLAAEKGTYTRTEAKLFLAQFLFAEGQRDTAVALLNQLRKEFPENTLFMVLYAFWQHRMDNYQEATVAANAALELNNRKKIRYGEDLAYSTLGSINFTLNDFSKARSYYVPYLKMTETDTRTPNWTHYRAGLACEAAGDRETAMAFYRRLKEPESRDRVWDAFLYRRGQDLLRRRITEAEVLIIRAENLSSQNEHTKAIETFNAALDKSGGNADEAVRALYGIQQAQFDIKNFEDAIATSNRLLMLKPIKESWIIPHSLFKLGQAYVKLGRPSEARNSFRRVDDYDDYDFQDRLESRVEEELKKLDQL